MIDYLDEEMNMDTELEIIFKKNQLLTVSVCHGSK